MSKKTVFQVDWLNESLHPDWLPWLQKVPLNPYKARCKICMKDIELSNMGKQAIISHTKSSSHQKNISSSNKQYGLLNFMKGKQDASVRSDRMKNVNASNEVEVLPVNMQQDSTPSNANASSCSIMESYIRRDAVTRAEVIFAMKSVMDHSSFRSCSDLGVTLKAMFPDSAIVNQFSLGKTKLSYMICYGLSPYFECLMKDRLKSVPKFVICFDEALNKIVQRGQMDLFIRFWDDTKQRVSTRFLTSVFLGHATAEDILKSFKEGLGDLPIAKILQISMDGPNVNWKFLRNLESEISIQSSNSANLLHCGSCGLHVVHGAFQTGHTASGWNLNTYLTASYSLFKNTPARRADFSSTTGKTVFPKKFCQCRWVENAEVADRAIDIMPEIQIYIKKFKSKLPSYLQTGILLEKLEDPLILPKLAFFSTVARDIEPFLTRFQSDAPMMPFLAEACEDLLRKLMKRFIPNNVLNSASTVSKLLQVDLTSKETLLKCRDVDIGFASKKFLVSNPEINTEMVMEFRSQARDFLSATCCKIIERSPLVYAIVRNLKCLNPENIVSPEKKSQCEKQFQSVLQILYDANQITTEKAEKAKHQYGVLCLDAQRGSSTKKHFDDYHKMNRSERMHLDEFYYNVLSNNENFTELLFVIKDLLILSHGNACVESGFSINKDTLIENLQETSLISLRRVYDSVKYDGGPLQVDINAKLLRYVRGSWSRYQDMLKRKREETQLNLTNKIAEKRVAEKLTTLNAKKLQLKLEAEAEIESIEKQISILKNEKEK